MLKLQAQAAWEGVERESLQDLAQWLTEVSAHLQEVQERVSSLPQQVGEARVTTRLEVLGLAGLELSWGSLMAVVSHLELLHIPHFR